MAKKYVWGNDPLANNVVMVALFLSSLIVGIILWDAAKGWDSGVGDAGKPASNLGLQYNWEYALVLFLFVNAYSQGFGGQLILKLVKKNSNPQAVTVADRVLGNTMEQSLPFLVLLTLYTYMIDYKIGWHLGVTYVVFTYLYGVCFAFYGHFTSLVEFSTNPRYIIINWYTLSLLCWFCGYDLRNWIGDEWWGCLLLILVTFFVTFPMMIFFWTVPTGFLSSTFNNKRNPADPSMKLMEDVEYGSDESSD